MKYVLKERHYASGPSTRKYAVIDTTTDQLLLLTSNQQYGVMILNKLNTMQKRLTIYG